MVVPLQRHPEEQLLRTLRRAVRSPCHYEAVATADEALAVLAALGRPHPAMAGWRVLADHRPAFGFPYGFGLAGSAVCHVLGRPDVFRRQNNVPGAEPDAPLFARVQGAALVTLDERCQELALDDLDDDVAALVPLLVPGADLHGRRVPNGARQEALPGLVRTLDRRGLAPQIRATLLLIGTELADEVGKDELAVRWLHAWFAERHHGHADVVTALALPHVARRLCRGAAAIPMHESQVLAALQELRPRLEALAHPLAWQVDEPRRRHLTQVPL